MAKFKVLKLNQTYLTRIGIHCQQPDEQTNVFFRTFTAYYYLFTIFSFTITSSAVFAYKNWPQMDIISEPCLIVIAGLQVIGMYLSVGINIRKVKALHNELQEIVDKGIFPFKNCQFRTIFTHFYIMKRKEARCSISIGTLSNSQEKKQGLLAIIR